jgi:putative Ca2+/H+ antiporter (TMEM165/GDT1 family)
MEAFIVSMLIVAVGEIGDKTQLLALLLAARFRRRVPIFVRRSRTTPLQAQLGNGSMAW